MARYTGPVCRLCRRVEEKLFLKGDRCYTPRCAVEKRRKLPGQHSTMRRRASDRSIQLKEKQKGRYTYGVLERQFLRYFKEAQKVPGVTGEQLLQWLERRLDNVVYRLGFAESRNQARQLVLHGHFTVNAKPVDIPSFSVKPGDVVSWRSSSAEKDFVKVLTDGIPKRPVPGWLSLDVGKLEGTVTALPESTDIDTKIQTRLIVEFYSK